MNTFHTVHVNVVECIYMVKLKWLQKVYLEDQIFLSRKITIIQELQELCSQVPTWKSPHDQLPPPSPLS